MKKIILIFVALVVFSLIGCSSPSEEKLHVKKITRDKLVGEYKLVPLTDGFRKALKLREDPFSESCQYARFFSDGSYIHHRSTDKDCKYKIKDDQKSLTDWTFDATSRVYFVTRPYYKSFHYSYRLARQGPSGYSTAKWLVNEVMESAILVGGLRLLKGDLLMEMKVYEEVRQVRVLRRVNDSDRE